MTYYAKVNKPATPYSKTPAASGTWFLNSTFLTLSNTVFKLNGYSTAVAPNQLSIKNPVTYTAA